MLTVNRLMSTLYDVLKFNSCKFVESSVCKHVSALLTPKLWLNSRQSIDR